MTRMLKITKILTSRANIDKYVSAMFLTLINSFCCGLCYCAFSLFVCVVEYLQRISLFVLRVFAAHVLSN